MSATTVPKVGARITVYWPDDDAWYKGTVADEDAEDDDRFFIQYDDGESDWINASKEKWRQSTKPDKFLKQYTSRMAKKTKRIDKLRVGSRVSVFWPLEKEYFAGQVTHIKKAKDDQDKTMHTIHYDDGDTACVDLLHHDFKNVKAKTDRLDVGSRISVHQQSTHVKLPGTVTEVDPQQAKSHKVTYDDADEGEEWLNLQATQYIEISWDRQNEGDTVGADSAHTLNRKKRRHEFMDFSSVPRRRKDRPKTTKKNDTEKAPDPKCEETCGLCNEGVKRPRVGSCHHIFCKRCLSQNEDYVTRSRCPICQITLTDLVEYQPDHVSFKPVEALERTTAEVVHTFTSPHAASRELYTYPLKTLCPGSIVTACQSKRRDDREYQGFYWRFQGSCDRILKLGEGVTDGIAVEQVDLDTGKILEVFPSGRKAFEKTRISRVVIKRVLERRGKANGGGFFWRYEGERHDPWPDPPPKLVTAVEKLDFETGEVLDSFVSLAEAKRAMGMASNSHCIRAVCEESGRTTAKGFFWRWKGSAAVPNHLRGVQKIIELREKKGGPVVKEFRTSKDAQAFFGFQRCWSTMGRHAREQEHAHGYFWQYRTLIPPKSSQEGVVGKRIRVQQPAGSDLEWLEGKINSFNSETGDHEIVYDSGIVEHHNLNNTPIHFVFKNDQGQKPVEQLDLKTGDVIATFESITAAAASMDPVGRPVQIIAAVCQDRSKSSVGFFWRYKGSTKLPQKLKGRKKVEQICLKTNRVVATYDTITAAGRALGITSPGISYCCNGRKGSRSAAGFGWRFSAE